MSKLPSQTSTYVGRFAPSPTGQLHQGSLLTAVASYLDARQAQGQWLVRMEDLDPPREQAGAADAILQSLEAHSLHWDQSVVYQSQRQSAYQERLHQLENQNLCYPCDCNRQRLKSMPAYDGKCRHEPPRNSLSVATRLALAADSDVSFEDLFQSLQHQQLNNEIGDFVIRRKDGLFAYQLAVVADDIDQGVTHVIRGVDLIDSTARQIYLFQLFQASTPIYGHLPVVVNEQGQKLSKQTFAAPLSNSDASKNLWQAMQRLGLEPPKHIENDNCEYLLQWGIRHWRRDLVPKCTQIMPSSTSQNPNTTNDIGIDTET